MLASVVIEYSVSSLNKFFDYVIPNDMINIIKVGHKVIVPFGKTKVEGFVLNIHNNFDEKLEYRNIIDIVNKDFYLNDELLNLGKDMSNYLLCNLISCYQAMLPKALKASLKTNINIKYETYVKLNDNITDFFSLIKNDKQKEIIERLKEEKELLKKNCSSSINTLIKNKIVIEFKKEVKREVFSLKQEDKNIVLTKDQEDAYNEIINSSDSKFLLYGVTGSGKTEVYIKLLKNAIKENKTAIVLVPEISLTPQIVARFKGVFKDKIAVFHSSLSEGQKYDEYRKIINGDVSIVVGARSAIFVPFENIGVIIVDECQSSTYKQESTPKYDAIDIAFKRGVYNNAKVILGSATPLLEQYARGKKGVFHLVTLKNRISKSFPDIQIVDMEIQAKKHNYIISDVLDNEIRKALNEKHQVILLLNRRGYSTFLSCKNCGYVYKCPNCDISLTYHKSSNSYSCHYCSYRCIKSDICPKCKEDSIRDLGLGTEKLQDLISKKYNCNVLRMDADSTSGKNSHQKLIKDFSSGKYDILVGTQMISKGLNFENVSLVGTINSDAILSLPDFRSAEKTYELLSQTSGRVGRFNIPGKVIIQTYNKDNYVYKCILANDFDLFFNYEMNIRKKLSYPPYYYICNILIISSSFDECKNASNIIKQNIDRLFTDKEFIVLGPSVCNILKLHNKYRFNIMIKYKNQEKLVSLLKEINEISIKNVKVDININI